jgi:probable HAF family extracellular repeat protein
VGWDINENGEVIFGGPGFAAYYFWSNEISTPLPAAFRGDAGINDAGMVVGSVITPGTIHHAATWLDGVTQDLGTFDGDESQAGEINNAGHIVGAYLLAGGTSSNDIRAFAFDGSTKFDLGSLPGGVYSNANDINDSDQIAGTTYIGSVTDGDARGFFYSNGVMTDIGSFGGPTQAHALNNLGNVVGASYLGSHTHAFLYDGIQMHDLGTGIGVQSLAYDINDSVQVVGAIDGNQADLSGAMIWDSVHGMRRLHDLIDPLSGWSSLDFAHGINNRGQIVGTGRRGNTDYAFLLIPVPEPSSMALVAVAALGVIGGAFNRVRV